MSLSKLSLDGNYDVIYKLFLHRDIPAGDGNIEKLFLQCTVHIVQIRISGSAQCSAKFWGIFRSEKKRVKAPDACKMYTYCTWKKKKC
jgi:hypothetical protein